MAMKLWHRKIKRSAFWNTGTHIPEEMPASTLSTSEDGGNTSLQRHYIYYRII